MIDSIDSLAHSSPLRYARYLLNSIRFTIHMQLTVLYWLLSIFADTIVVALLLSEPDKVTMLFCRRYYNRYGTYMYLLVQKQQLLLA